MASCDINLGRHKASAESLAKAEEAARGISDFEVAVIKGYEHLQNEVPLGAWKTYLKQQREQATKTRRVTEEDVFGNLDRNDDGIELMNILNLTGREFTTSRGKTETDLSYEAVKAIGIWKRHLIERGAPLSDSEVKNTLNALRAVVKQGKRKAKWESKRISAKKVIRKKLWQDKELFTVLDKLFNISTKFIRDYAGDNQADVESRYNQILDRITRREAILDISKDEIRQLKEDAEFVLQELGTIPEDVALITEEDKTAALMEFKNLVSDPDAFSKDQRMQRDIANELNTLTEEDLEVLDAAEIVYLVKGIKAMNNGMDPQLPVMKALRKVKQARVSKKITKSFRNTEGLSLLANAWSRGYGKLAEIFGDGNKNMFEYLFRSRSIVYAGDIIGDAGNVLYKEAGYELTKATERATIENEGLLNRADEVSDLLGVGNKRVEKIYTTAILSFVEQAESNVDQWTAEELIDSYIENGKKTKSINDASIKMMEKLKKKYMKDGKIDKEKLLADVEADKGMSALRQFNKDNSVQQIDKLVAVTAMRRGQAVPIISNHSPYRVLWTPKKGSVDPREEFRSRMQQAGKKASATHERMDRKGLKVAPVVDFDLLTSSTNNASELITDFHITPAAQLLYNTADDAVNTLVDEGASERAIAAAKGWRGFIQAEVQSVIENNTEDWNFLDAAAASILRANYAAKLVRVDKFVSETFGNALWWGIEDPGAWARGFNGHFSKRDDKALIFYNIGTIQTTKLQQAGVFAGKEVDPTQLGRTGRRGNTVSEYESETLKKVAQAAGKIGKVGQKISSGALSVPDRMITNPGFIGTFERSFEAETGIKLGKKEYDLIALNDEAFMNKHADAIKKAVLAADEKSVRAASTANTAAAVARFKKNPRDKALRKFYKMAAGYMMNFSINEGAAWKHYFRAAIGRGEMSRAQGAKGMVAVTLRMAAYRPMMTAVAIMLAKLGWGDEDDAEKGLDDVLKELVRDIYGSLLTNTLQGTQGGWIRQISALFVEYFNKKQYGDDYNAFEHSLMFVLIRDKNFRKNSKLADILFQLSGPAGGVLKDFDRVWQAAFDPNKNTEELFDDFMLELALLISAYTHVNPFYRDIVKNKDAKYWNERNSGRGRTRRKPREGRKPRKRER